jgi:replicative DNA helicase
MWESKFGTRHIKEIALETFEIIEKRYARGEAISGIPSGIKALDVFTDGFHPSLYVIAGRPSMGKSVLLKDCAINAAAVGHKPHVVNIEDGNCSTVKRVFSSMSSIEMWKLNKGQLTRTHWEGLTQAVAKLAEYDITMNDTISDTERIEGSIREAVSNGCDIVFLDYLQLVQTDDRKGKKRMEEIGAITRNLKELSKPSNLNIPIVVTAQLNRAVDAREDKRPFMSDLRESGEIEQHADVIMFLYREGYYTKKPEHKEAEINIAKGRNIGTSTIKVIFNDMLVRFQDDEEVEAW